MIADNFSAKLGKKYYCSCCDYTCYYISDMDKHNLTRKHQYRTKLNVLEQNIEQNSANLGKPFMCCCGKGYSARHSLWYHKQKCATLTNTSSEKETILQVDDHMQTSLILELVKQNHEFKQLLIDVLI